jgi:hypothetical protein
MAIGSNFFNGARLNPSTQTQAKNTSQASSTQGVSRLVSTVSQASAHWVSQWGPTSSNNPAGSGVSKDIPYGFQDCGPTSAVILASALGLKARPSAQNASKAIDQMRDKALGFNSDYSRLTSADELARALNDVGAKTEKLTGSVAAVDKALKEGKSLMAVGNPWQPWGSEMSKGPNGNQRQLAYLNSRDPGPHWVTVLGKTPQGKYLVADPLSKVGAIEVSARQLETFFANEPKNRQILAAWNPKAVTSAPAPKPSAPAPKPSTPAPTSKPSAPASKPSAPAPAPAPASSQGPLPRTGLAANQRGPEVEKLQRALVATGYLSQKDMATGPGNFGTRTQAALAGLQEDHGIIGNQGVEFGTRSQAALSKALLGLVPKNDLQVGQSGAEVQKLQRALVATGYLSQADMNTGPGNFGTRTQAALAKFQTDHGITGNNGLEFGPRSRAALERVFGR